jgi:uncharacterized protein involved in exopolysaccharide biosynthesis
MSNEENFNTYADDEISLRDIILKIKEFTSELIRYWWLLLVIALAFMGIMLFRYYTTPPTYSADMTFTLRTFGKGSSPAAALLGNFGLGLEAGEGFSIKRMLDLAKSRRVITGPLFSMITINGKNDYVANHLIRLYDKHEEWAKSSNEKMRGFLFTHSNIDKFDDVEKSIYSTVTQQLNSLYSIAEDKETKIITLSVNSRNKELTMFLCNNIYESISEYYIQQSIEKEARNYEITRKRADSTGIELITAELRLAQYRQQNRDLRLETEKIKENALERIVERLSFMYRETARSMETAKFNLDNQTPIFQEIDRPLYASPSGTTLKKTLIIGILLGSFIAIAFIVTRKIIRDAMQE